jgi:Tol biopolymer transport system component
VAELSNGGKSRILETFVGINPTWSPDGSSLAFSRHSTRGDNSDLVVRSVKTGEEKVLSYEGLRVGPPRWLHEGKGFIEYVLTPGAPLAAKLVDLKSGEFKEVFSAPELTGVSALSHDDKTLYFASRDPKIKATNILDRILAVDLTSATVREIIAFPNSQGAKHAASIGFALSPDGRMLAISRLDNETWDIHLAIAGLDGSNYHEIGSFKAALQPYDKLAWSKDGRSILFASNDGDSNGVWHIMRLGIEGGKPEFTGLDVKALSTFDLSPDGSHIAFSTLASGNRTSEMFAIDNLASLLRDPQ